jgi:hypothetical protein
MGPASRQRLLTTADTLEETLKASCHRRRLFMTARSWSYALKIVCRCTCIVYEIVHSSSSPPPEPSVITPR